MKLILSIIFSISLLISVNSSAEGAAPAASSWSMNSGSLMGASQFIDGAAGNALAGAGLMVECVATPPNYISCGLAALAFSQAIEDSDGASDARNVSNAVDPNNFDFGSPTDFNNSEELFRNPENIELISRKGLKELEDKGVTYDEENNMLNTPKGSTGASMGAMASSGLYGEEDLEDVKKKIAEMNDKYKVSSMKIASNGGGRRGSRRPASSSYEGTDYSKLFAKKRGPRAPKTKGLSRRAGGELIGVKTGNLFDMIHDRYKAKREQKTFVETRAQRPKK